LKKANCPWSHLFQRGGPIFFLNREEPSFTQNARLSRTHDHARVSALPRQGALQPTASLIPAVRRIVRRRSSRCSANRGRLGRLFASSSCALCRGSVGSAAHSCELYQHTVETFLRACAASRAGAAQRGTRTLFAGFEHGALLWRFVVALGGRVRGTSVDNSVCPR
jgi:hypothetical protein